MPNKRSDPEAGTVLLVSLLLVVISLALAGSMIMVSVSDAGAVRGSEERTKAFHLAESGLQHARWEISEEQDGNQTTTTSAGIYTVAATDLGDRFYRLISTGRSGQTEVAMEQVIEKDYVSKFPGGAMSMVGGLLLSSSLFSSSTNLILDGGDSPGVAFNDSTLYNSVTTQFAQGVNTGFLQESDVTGSVTNVFQPGNVDLSMQLLAPEDSSIALYGSMYSDFEATVTTQYLPTATSKTLPSSGNATYGSSASPVKYKLPTDQKLSAGQTLSGHGTLVFSRNFIVENGATINWNGNIIVHGDPGNDASLSIGGNVNVTGNLVLLGGKTRNTKFTVVSTGNVTVNGALTCLTEYVSTGTKSEFLVESQLNVNGLLTSVASKHQMLLKPGSDINVSGSFQVGRPIEALTNTELVMDLDGSLEVHKDNEAIMQGANALADLGGPVGTHVLRDVMTSPTVKTHSWRELPH